MKITVFNRVEITLHEELLKRLVQRARQNGESVESYIERVLRADVEFTGPSHYKPANPPQE